MWKYQGVFKRQRAGKLALEVVKPLMWLNKIWIWDYHMMPTSAIKGHFWALSQELTPSTDSITTKQKINKQTNFIFVLFFSLTFIPYYIQRLTFCIRCLDSLLIHPVNYMCVCTHIHIYVYILWLAVLSFLLY